MKGKGGIGYEGEGFRRRGKYMGQAGSTMLAFSVASWIIISRLWVKILIPFQVILMKKTPFEPFFSMFSNVHQNNDKL